MTPTTAITEPVKQGPLLDQIEDAALQHWYLHARQRDLEQSEEPWELRYAVGTDVLLLHAQPEEQAAHSQKQIIGAGEVFRDDPTEIKVKVAAALGAFIWFKLDAERPLLLIPPTNRQVKRNIAALGREFLANSMTEATPLEDWAKKFEARADSLNSADAAMIREMTLVDRGRTLERVHGLLEAGRVLSLDAGKLPHSFGTAFVAALRPALGKQEHEQQDTRLKRWIKELIPYRSHDSRGIWEAAETLAGLEMFNERLVAAGHVKKRLLLITGDQSMFDAARHVMIREGECFADAYLRHPRAFLDEPGVLRPESEGDEAAGRHARASEVLAICLGRFHDVKDPLGPPSGGRIALAKGMKKQIAEVEKLDPSAHGRTREQWLAVAKAAASFEPPQLYLDQLSEMLAKPDEFREALNRLRPLVVEKASEAWDRFFEVSVELRFVIEVHAKGGPQARLLPSLLFEQLPGVDSFFDAMRGWLRAPKSFRMDEYRKLRRGLEAPGGNAPPDEARYYSFLAHGWLLASQGQWSSASILADRATAAARRNDPPLKGRANGREANYFSAFARRHIARRAEDLNGLEALLDEAARIAGDEKADTAQEIWPLDVVPERFQAERLALKLSRLLFAWDDAERAMNIDGARRSLALIGEMAGEVWSFTEQIEANAADQAQHAQEFDESGGQGPDHQPRRADRASIRAQLLHRAWRNLFGIGLMVPGNLATARRAWEKLREAQAEIGNGSVLAEGRDELDSSSFAQLVTACATHLFDADLDKATEATASLRARREALKLGRAGPKGPNNLLVFPYDRRRFMRWIDVALQPRPSGS